MKLMFMLFNFSCIKCIMTKYPQSFNHFMWKIGIFIIIRPVLEISIMYLLLSHIILQKLLGQLEWMRLITYLIRFSWMFLIVPINLILRNFLLKTMLITSLKSSQNISDCTFHFVLIHLFIFLLETLFFHWITNFGVIFFVA